MHIKANQKGATKWKYNSKWARVHTVGTFSNNQMVGIAKPAERSVLCYFQPNARMNDAKVHKK